MTVSGRLVCVTCIVGLSAVGLFHQDAAPVATAQPPDAAEEPPDLASLHAEIERLKGMVPDQAHVMQDVDYHFTNLWFAAQQGNWPLAQFCFNETKSHLRWAVRIIPIRKDNAGEEVRLEAILEAFENGPLTQLQEAITAEERERFVSAYEFTITSCYACHKAADKPFLRPQIPDHPATNILEFDPRATWPM